MQHTPEKQHRFTFLVYCLDFSSMQLNVLMKKRYQNTQTIIQISKEIFNDFFLLCIVVNYHNWNIDINKALNLNLGINYSLCSNIEITKTKRSLNIVINLKKKTVIIACLLKL